ncbi:MAG: type II toxin-antitoxin system RelE/ParE family toxin [Acidobacteria bacterium]|nr:type II toxin-antitoxin system RelE/ParE family toxin [Acidobacteriota bacterium]
MPARFSVLLTPSFRRDLERLPTGIQSRVLRAVSRLEHNPFGPPGRVKMLKAKGVGQWRLEVWPYRVRYDVSGCDVVLYRVRHRSEIYRD